MKVLMINGSPHAKGTTFGALTKIGEELNLLGIDYEILHTGNKNVSGCLACGGCSKTGRCVVDGDLVNLVIEKIEESDGLIIGTPVYYAGINGTLKSLLDRVFYARKGFANKPASSIAVARRAGTTATLEIINKYFMISSMPVISSTYWNMVFGSNANDIEKDLEGLQTMRNLARNMAYVIKSFKIAKENGLKEPNLDRVERTNFIK